MKRIITIASLAALVCTPICAQETLKLAGSDLIAPCISGTLQDLAKKGNINLDINMRGTYSAFEDLKNGKSDIAIIALPKGRNAPDGLTLIPFAYQVAVVIANPINPLEEISAEQLKNIFSASADNRLESWQQLNIKNIGMRNIMPVLFNDSKNVVVELFKYSAMDGTNIASWVNVVPSMQDLINTVKSNNSALAVVGKVQDPKTVKIIAVSKGGNSQYAFRPDINSIFNGDYPMTLNFYIAYDKKNSAKIKPLVKMLLDNSIAQCIDSSDFFSAPENSRKKSLFELDIAQ